MELFRESPTLEAGQMSSRDDAKILIAGASPRGWHRLQLAAECLQKYSWTYRAPHVEGVPAAQPALVRGTLLHLALAQHYARMRAEQDDTDVEDWVEPTEAVSLVAKVEGWVEFVPHVLATYAQYATRYEQDIREMHILEIEELYQTTIAGKYLLTGRLDLVYEAMPRSVLQMAATWDTPDPVYVLDHKSSSKLSNKHKQFYSVSGQLLGYAHMARKKWGSRFAGVQVNLVQTTSPAFDRILLPRSPNLEARFERIVVDIEESIERVEKEGRSFDDWPKAINEMTCFGRYGACHFIDQCRWGVGSGKGGNWTWEDGR